MLYYKAYHHLASTDQNNPSTGVLLTKVIVAWPCHSNHGRQIIQARVSGFNLDLTAGPKRSQAFAATSNKENYRLTERIILSQ